MLKSIELSGFKSFAKKSVLDVDAATVAIVGPNGSGKSNSAEAFRFVLGEQSIKSMRGKKGEDLIWGGTDLVPRAGRAAVKVRFDNAARLLDVDFDEVTIERVVHRDGANEYFINGSRVRLKDITALLAGANIGSSGHHIISQGEADRILNAGARERREMLEDALGLKVYQYKKTESEKKLEKTDENVKEVESARRELAPHLKFLTREMKKREHASELRDELSTALALYLARENAFINKESTKLSGAKDAPENELKRLDEELEQYKDVEQSKESTGLLNKLAELEKEIDTLTGEKSNHTRELGRIEGQLSLLRTQMSRAGTINTTLPTVKWSSVERLTNQLITETKVAENSREPDVLRGALRSVRVSTEEFVRNVKGAQPEEENNRYSEEKINELEKEKEQIEQVLAGYSAQEETAEGKRKSVQQSIEQQKSKSKDTQLKVLEVSAKRSAVRGELASIEREETTLRRIKVAFEEEIREGITLLGRAAQEYQDVDESQIGDIDRDEQETERRKIERMKIKLEEVGVVGDDVVEEYKNTVERDEFLARELEDLKNSSESLSGLITSLEGELATRFKEGLAKVNEEFQNFFSILFGGGRAQLDLTKQKKKKASTSLLSGIEEIDEDVEEEYEEGVDVRVHLPRKKASSLEILSGGERALTSIAIIFAMSQVNPPPFIILDETDAALDEANSKRYADMVRALSERSQLILITHNRETMAAASELYGVTMGADGASRLLSVKLDEAVAVAK